MDIDASRVVKIINSEKGWMAYLSRGNWIETHIKDVYVIPQRDLLWLEETKLEFELRLDNGGPILSSFSGDRLNILTAPSGTQYVDPKDYVFLLPGSLKDHYKMVNRALEKLAEEKSEIEKENKREDKEKNKKNYFHFDCHWGF